MSCPGLLEFEGFLNDTLADAERDQIEKHLAGCPRCRARLAEVRENLGFVDPVARFFERRKRDELATLRPPRVIGPYRIIAEIGRGGMGVVYEAEQRSPSRRVAVKVVRATKHANDDQIRLFQHETRALARLRHSSIAAILEAGVTEDGEHYFAMELIHGVPLNNYARNKRLPQRQRLELFRKICEGINYAHRRGVIHLDLKPSNILVEGNGCPKILDFGLARLVDADGATGSAPAGVANVQGTLPFMSPERIRGDPGEVDLRSDVYSLGVILYELITDVLPFSPERLSPQNLVHGICEGILPSPGSIKNDISGDMAAVVLKALRKEPGGRYQSTLALSEDIARCLTNQPLSARPLTPAHNSARW